MRNPLLLNVDGERLLVDKKRENGRVKLMELRGEKREKCEKLSSYSRARLVK